MQTVLFEGSNTVERQAESERLFKILEKIVKQD
jgi:hypothetical protein